MKKLFAITLLFSVLSLVTSVDAKDTQLSVHNGNGIKISYPKKWKITNFPMEGAIFQVKGASVDGQIACMVRTVNAKSQPRQTTESFINSINVSTMYNIYKKEMPDIIINSGNKFVNNKVSAYKLIFTAMQNDELAKFTQLITLHNYKYYYLICKTAESAYQANKRDIDIVVQSFQFAQ
jgi:hypothetical protein